MCGFIIIFINNKVKKSTFLYKMDHEKGDYRVNIKNTAFFVSKTTPF